MSSQLLETPVAVVAELDPWSPEALSLSQNNSTVAVAKKLLVNIPVRKPGAFEFFRVNPDPAYRLDAATIEIGESRETYLVTPSVRAVLPPNYCKPCMLYLTVNRQGVVGIWPVKLQDSDRALAWYTSAAEAAEKAMSQWVSIAANMSAGAYDVQIAMVSISDPVWPELTFTEILKIAFKGRLITSTDHLVIQQRLGLA
jgi:hypothetical protein